MRRQRKVKILATLGPASGSREMIEKLFVAGADVFRINMSHTSHDRLNEMVALIRAVEKDLGRPIGILADLQGPKLRIGEFANGPVQLTGGTRFILDSDPAPGDTGRVFLPHPEILSALRPGDALLLDDGKVRLKTLECDGKSAVTEVVVGGRMSARKGVSLPDTEIPVSSMTTKDHADLQAALAARVDFIALSFVQRPEDVLEARQIVNGRAVIMSKIEKPQAIQRLQEIIEVSDALMVARGDLGVELPLEKVPGLQKRIVRAARKLGKPVVVATQMLESMITSPVPTRAEVSDVATAVYEGADAVMLSAESAAGSYPVEAVRTMNRIAEEVESDSLHRTIINAQRSDPEQTGADAIAAAAHTMSQTLDIAALVAWTASGSTGLRIARERAEKPLLALTPIVETARRLALVWGTHAVLTADARDINDMVSRACHHASHDGFAKTGQRVLVMAGVPFGTPGATNLIRIAVIGEPGTV